MRATTLTLVAVSLCLVACSEPATGDGDPVDSGAEAQPPNEDGGLPVEDAAPPGDDGAVPDATDGGVPPAQDGAPLPDAEPPGSGCGLAPGANDRAWTLMHQGIERVFHVHFPPGYNPATPTPVVLNFHGRNSNAQQQMFVAKMIALADGAGFIVVHPEGIGGTWNAGLCCGEAMNANIDDVGFTRAMIERLEAELCVDARRVYATGLSNGGYMAHRLACELSDRIAAISSVAGTNAFLSCSPQRAVPVYHFHGTADAIVPYDGFGGYTSVSATMEYWKNHNGCNAGSQVFFSQGEVVCEEWTGCVDEATVRLCTIEGGGHQWPGGFTIPGLGNNTNLISATDETWSFFASHPRP